MHRHVQRGGGLCAYKSDNGLNACEEIGEVDGLVEIEERMLVLFQDGVVVQDDADDVWPVVCWSGILRIHTHTHTQ